MQLKDILPLVTTFNCVTITVFGEAKQENGSYVDNILDEIELDDNESDVIAKYGDHTVTDIWATGEDEVQLMII